MKRQIIIGSMLAATLAGGSFGAWGVCAAATRPAKGDRACGEPRGGMSPEKRLAHMAKKLGLSDAQQGQIKAIFAAEREKSKPLMEKMRDYRQQMRDAAKATPFDEAAVRSVATNRAQTEIELAVSRARVRNQINALLTPEQQAKLEKLRPPRKQGRGIPPHPDGEVPLP
ncbi:MAG: hypothetical protein CXR31_07965 [Geobacter sp.]|nr:MAG: hypothetical protein CXR31_07965 [Geobacter sp.]